MVTETEQKTTIPEKISDKDEKKKKADKKDEMSEEDKHLKEELDMLMERLHEKEESLYSAALESMRTLIRSSTTSMTSVPKPLKFMRDHYGSLKQIFEKINNQETKALCADIISVLGMTMSDKEDTKKDTLNYRFLGSREEIGSWGHEYVRHLTLQIVSSWSEHELAGPVTSEDETKMDVDQQLSEENATLKSRCLALVEQIVPYLMKHNAEAEAIDLLVEIDYLSLISKYADKSNYQRVCLYMVSMVPYLPDPDNTKLLRAAAELYEQVNDLGQAMRCALRLNDTKYAQKLFRKASTSADDLGKELSSEQKQLAFLLARQQYAIPYEETLGEGTDAAEDLAEMMGNTRLSEYYMIVARELDVMDVKVPEDIYKSGMDPPRTALGMANLDSARANLAGSYVNGMLNCGYGKDKLIMEDDNNMRWIYKNKEIGMLSTVATLGWIMLWDVDSGLSVIDKYLFSNEDYIKAGGLLACGVVNSCVKNDCDPAQALLGEHVDGKSGSGWSPIIGKAAIIGLGVAYAGTMKESALEKLHPVILNPASDKFELACLASLSAGLIAVGTLNNEVTSNIMQTLMERPDSQFQSSYTKLMVLGLALTCLGRQEDADVVLALVEALGEPLKSMAHLLCDICAYACTGNVLKIQKLLLMLSEKYEDKKPGATRESVSTKGTSDTASTMGTSVGSSGTGTSVESTDLDGASVGGASPKESSGGVPPTPLQSVQSRETASTFEDEEDKDRFNFLAHQGIAVLGIGLIAMGEDIGLDMAYRTFGHLLRFGESPIKRAVPLAMSLCYVGDPQLKVMDTLSKFSHDSDAELSHNSILAMGIIGAGTVNARLGGLLRQLAIFHQKDNYNQFMVRLSQGLVHLGKGMLTLSPFHSDRFLYSPAALAGLLIFMVTCLDIKKTILNKQDYLMFYLTPAIQPRLLMTFDENKQHLIVTVRIGQAVDVVGQAGKPKTITGFQTQTTPTLIPHGYRAELTSDEYIPVSNLPLEGFVILKKNPNYEGSSSTTTGSKKK